MISSFRNLFKKSSKTKSEEVQGPLSQPEHNISRGAQLPPVPVASALSPDYDPSRIRKEDLDLSVVGKPEKLAFLLHNVFTPEECQALVKLSEDAGYGIAMIDIGGGAQVLAKGYRDGCRVIIDDPEFVRLLFSRISSFLPSEFKDEELIEINERLRFLRYDPHDKFLPHHDGYYTRPDDSAETLITLQMYLNEGFGGGETTFLSEEGHPGDKSLPRLPVVPKTGMILVFEHEILHEGSVVTSGRKYTIRTDVLYTLTK